MKQSIIFISTLLLFACKTQKPCTEILNPACSCIEQYEPVCGCNNITYGNACMAECANIRTYTKGECPSQNKLEGTVWQLTLFAVGPEPKAVPENLVISIKFENGRIAAHGGCNGISGNYKLKNRHVMLSGLVSTKMYCEETMQYESFFLQMLEQAKTYSISGEILEINCGDMGNLVFRQNWKKRN